MKHARPRASRRDAEIVGFLLSLAFAGSTAVRDVYLGGLFQRVNPLLVALTTFTLCVLAFLPVAVVSDPGGLASLPRLRGRLFWVNATTALAWISFFFALKTIEPALVQVLFYGVGPLSVRWLDGLIPGSTRATMSGLEHALHRGLLGALLVAGGVVLGGYSGFGPQAPAAAASGIALAIGGGISISISTLLSRALNDAGLRPATVMAARFPGAIVLTAGLVLASPVSVRSGVTPDAMIGVALAALALIVVPNYVNQVGVALASPVTVRAVLAVGPVLVFALELAEGRLSSSPWTLAACVLYALVAVAAALARRRAIGAVSRSVATAGPRPLLAPPR